MPALPYAELGLILIAIVGSVISFFTGRGSGVRIGKAEEGKRISDWLREQQSFIQKRIESTPKPQDHGSALDRL